MNLNSLSFLNSCTKAPSALSCGSDTANHRSITCAREEKTSDSINKNSQAAKIKPPKTRRFERWQTDKLQERSISSEALRCFWDANSSCHVTLPFERSHTANCLCNGIKKKKALLEWQSRQPPPSGQLAFNVTQQQSTSADSYGRAMCRTPAESQSLPPHLLHSGSSVGGLPPFAESHSAMRTGVSEWASQCGYRNAWRYWAHGAKTSWRVL